jgi:flagellar protein FlgJ
MRQPMPMDFGGENSGGGAMQFIESEFARREGRPDPRMAMGAPGQIYNAFVQQPTQATQMPTGGGSMPMGGAPAAQAQPPPQGGMITPEYVRAVMTSRATTDADKQWVMGMYNQQRAAQQADAERARAEQQNRETAEALNIDPRLGGVAPVVSARAAQMFAKPEGTTSDQRELVQVNRERQAAGLPTIRMDEYKIQKAKAGASSVNVNTGSKADEKFSEAFAKGDADALGTIAAAGMAARRNMGRIDRLETLLNASQTGGLAVLKQRAGEFGINTKGLKDIQAAQALISSLVPEQRQPGSGPMSDADLALYKESLVRIINQPDGNKRIIEGLRGIAKYDAEGAAIVQQLRENKINRAQAFEMLQNRVNPLAEFSQPPARTGAPAQPGAPRIISRERIQ